MGSGISFGWEKIIMGSSGHWVGGDGIEFGFEIGVLIGLVWTSSRGWGLMLLLLRLLLLRLLLLRLLLVLG